MSSEQEGQVLPILAIGLIVIAVAVGVAIDTGRYAWKTITAHDDAATACVDAVEAWDRGQDPWAHFEWSLQSNGYTVDDYYPNDGTGTDLARGYEWQADGTLRTALLWTEPTSFLQIVGMYEFPVQGRARCQPPEASVQPIAVRESAVDESLEDPSLSYPILGNSPKWDLADEESGTNFRGAVYPHIVCSDGQDCQDVQCYDPVDPCPPTSPQPYKDIVQDCFEGIGCAIQHPAGTYLPIVSGTSNAKLVKAMDPWVGQLVVVMVFDGEVYTGDGTNYETTRITHFAVYEVTKVRTNQVEARLYSGPFNSLDEVDVDYEGGEITW